MKVGDRVMVKHNRAGPLFTDRPATVLELEGWGGVLLKFDGLGEWFEKPSHWSIEQLRLLPPLEDLARVAS